MSLLDTTAGAFNQNFPKRSFTLRHALADSHLFKLDRLADLAAELPADKIDFNRATLPRAVSAAQVPGNGLSPAETVREIETCGSWMVLKNLDLVPEYKAVLDDLVDELAMLAGVTPDAFGHRAMLGFVTSPGGMTPFHLDSEHNFLLQMRGAKRMTILPHQDVIAPIDLEIAPSKSRYIEFKPEYEAKARTFDLGPGDMLCVPYNDPHYVENGPEVSVSVGITFHDAASWRLRKIATMNHLLRKVGLPQPAPGQGAADGLKAAAYDMADLVMEPIRRNAGMRQFVKRHVIRAA